MATTTTTTTETIGAIEPTLSEEIRAEVTRHHDEWDVRAEHLAIKGLYGGDLEDWAAQAVALEAVVAVLDEYAAAHLAYETMPPRPTGSKHTSAVVRWVARRADIEARVQAANRRLETLVAERAALSTDTQG